MAGVVASVFNTAGDAEHAIQDLINARFSDEKIGVVVHDRDIGPGLADDLGREYRSGMNPPANELTNPSDVYETLPGGFAKALRDQNAPVDDEMRWFSDQLDAHKVLVIVNAGDRMGDAERILHNDGGMGFPMTGQAQPRMEEQQAMRTAPTPVAREELHVPVIDEEVLVEKTSHQVGEVEIASETTTRDVDIPLTVVHEELRVERRKLDRPMRLEEYKGSTTEPGVIRMPIVEEEVRVTKTPVIREEFIVTRMPVAEQQMLHETVMHTEPEVETTGTVEVEGLTEEMKEERKRRPAA